MFIYITIKWHHGCHRWPVISQTQCKLDHGQQPWIIDHQIRPVYCLLLSSWQSLVSQTDNFSPSRLLSVPDRTIALAKPAPHRCQPSVCRDNWVHRDGPQASGFMVVSRFFPLERPEVGFSVGAVTGAPLFWPEVSSVDEKIISAMSSPLHTLNPPLHALKPSCRDGTWYKQ